MAEQMSLDSILDEKPAAAEPPAPAAPPAEAPPPKDPVENQQAERNAEDHDYRSKKEKFQEKEFNAQGLTRDPATGQFTKKQPDADPLAQKPDAGTPIPAAANPAPAVPAQEQMTAKEAAFLRAAQEERGKRQELERRLAALEKQPAAETKTFWDDPEAALAKHRQEIDGVVASTRMNTSEAIARGRYQDFDEKIGAFGQIAASNPWLAAQCQQAPDPAEFAYRMGKNHIELQQVGGMDAMRQKIEQETAAKTRATVEAEFKAKQDALAKERAALPGSISDARGTSLNKAVWNGPPSLDSILKG